MTPVLSRLSEAAATSLMCSGRLAALLARTRIDVETELGCDHDLLADRGKRLAHQFLVGERAVDFGGVEKRNATRLVRAFSGLPPLLPEPPTAGASVCVAG